MTEYSFLTGIWKSIKNTAIILLPAGAAGWAAFQAEVPPDYQCYIMAIAGFAVYLAKNYIQVKLE